MTKTYEIIYSTTCDEYNQHLIQANSTKEAFFLAQNELEEEYPDEEIEILEINQRN